MECGRRLHRRPHLLATVCFVLNELVIGYPVIVAAGLLAEGGRRFDGVRIDTGSGTGLCAEHAAIAAMVTAGEYHIRASVAVWRDERGRLYVLPPCGRCRGLIRQIDPANLGTAM